MIRRALLIALLLPPLLSVLTPSLASAQRSDFWSDVREPERSSSEARSAIERGVRAIGEQQYAIATREALAALSKAPESAEAHILLGNAQLFSGNAADAARSFERAFTLKTEVLRDPNVAMRVAHAAIQAGRYPLAINALRAMIAGLPAIAMRAASFHRLADLLQSEGALEEAVLAYRNALIEARALHPQASIGLALALQRLGRADEAAPYLSRAAATTDIERIIQEVPGHPSERLARYALIHRARGEHAEARALFLKVSEESPHHREHALAEAKR